MIDVTVDTSVATERLQKIHDNLLTEVSNGIDQASNLLRDFAKARHRFLTRTGNLENSIENTKASINGDVISSKISVNLEKAPYGKFIHGGTKRHFVGPPREAKALSWIDPYTGRRCFSKGHYVNGIKRDAFLYEAAILRADTVNKIIEDSVKKAVKV